MDKEDLDPTAEAVSESGSCAVLKTRLERSNNWLDAFTALVFIVALSAAVMLGTAILLAVDNNLSGTIAAGVGTVLGGSGFGVLLKLKSSQDRELKQYMAKWKELGCEDKG